MVFHRGTVQTNRFIICFTRGRIGQRRGATRASAWFRGARVGARIYHRKCNRGEKSPHFLHPETKSVKPIENKRARVPLPGAGSAWRFASASPRPRFPRPPLRLVSRHIGGRVFRVHGRSEFARHTPPAPGKGTRVHRTCVLF